MSRGCWPTPARRAPSRARFPSVFRSRPSRRSRVTPDERETQLSRPGVARRNVVRFQVGFVRAIQSTYGGRRREVARQAEKREKGRETTVRRVNLTEPDRPHRARFYRRIGVGRSRRGSKSDFIGRTRARERARVQAGGSERTPRRARGFVRARETRHDAAAAARRNERNEKK